MSVKLPECILTGMNESVEVRSPTRSENQETLLYFHFCQRGGFPLMYASSKALQIIYDLGPREGVEFDGISIGRWALRNPTSANSSIEPKMI